MSSFAMLARDAITTRVKALPFFATFTFASTKAFQIQPDDIPVCAIYLINEIMTADSDANAGEVRFRTLARIGFSVIVQNNDDEVAEQTLDQAYTVLMDSLLTDPTLYHGQAVRIQAFPNADRTHVFGSTGVNETPVAELQLNLTCDLGTISYEPTITDPFDTLHLETRYPAGSDPNEVQQVVAQYDLPQNESEAAKFSGSGTLKADATVI